MFVPASPDDLLGNLRCLQSANAKRQFRQDILAAWDHSCCYCGRPDASTLDHLRPKALGGSSFRGNLAACCRRCNKSKGTEDIWSWYQSQPFYSEDRANAIRSWMYDDQ